MTTSRHVSSLRAGEDWNERLMELIRTADVFQLFWSWNSIDSPFVRREYEYATRLGRENFIRPVYWEEPLPARPEKNLPPDELRRLHFHRLPTQPAPPESRRTDEGKLPRPMEAKRAQSQMNRDQPPSQCLPGQKARRKSSSPGIARRVFRSNTIWNSMVRKRRLTCHLSWE